MHLKDYDIQYIYEKTALTKLMFIIPLGLIFQPEILQNELYIASVVSANALLETNQNPKIHFDSFFPMKGMYKGH